MDQRVEAAGLNAARQKAGDYARAGNWPSAFGEGLHVAWPDQSSAGLPAFSVERNVHAFRAVGGGRGGHDGVALDGHRQHETVVVVGVFADDVDAARGGGDPARGACP